MQIQEVCCNKNRLKNEKKYISNMKLAIIKALDDMCPHNYYFNLLHHDHYDCFGETCNICLRYNADKWEMMDVEVWE